MKPNIYMGSNSIEELGHLYPNRNFHLWHIPEIDNGLLRNIKSNLGGRILSQQTYHYGMPELNQVASMHEQFSLTNRDPHSVILGIGGGSLMDFAKVIRFTTLEKNWFKSQLDSPINVIPDFVNKHPLILAPTTAGTGSEVTGTATIWDFNSHKKHSFFGEEVYADEAIIDHQLCFGAPWELTRDSGLDALSHAIESIWNKNATADTRDQAIKAIQKICINLPLLHANINHPEARKEISEASLLAGLAMAKTQTSLVHALSYGETITHKFSHGFACAIWLPNVLKIAKELPNQNLMNDSLELALGQHLSSPKALFDWIKALGIPAYDPDHLTQEQIVKIEQAKLSSRGKNFLGSN
jgi:alcohol dehydrogenase class IV